MSAIWAYGQKFNTSDTTMDVSGAQATVGTLADVLDSRPSKALLLRLLGGQTGVVDIYNPFQIDVPFARGFVINWRVEPISPDSELAALGVEFSAIGIAGGLPLSPLNAYGKTDTSSGGSGSIFFETPTASSPFGIRLSVEMTDILGAHVYITHARYITHVWELPQGVDTDWTLVKMHYDEVQRSDSGESFRLRAGQSRNQVSFSLSARHEDDVFLANNALFEMQREIDTTKPVWFIPRQYGGMAREAATLGYMDWPSFEHNSGPYWRVGPFTLESV